MLFKFVSADNLLASHYFYAIIPLLKKKLYGIVNVKQSCMVKSKASFK